VLWKNNTEPYILNESEFIKGCTLGSIWKNNLFGEVRSHNILKNTIQLNKSQNKIVDSNFKNVLNNLIDWVHYIQYNLFCIGSNIDNPVEYFLDDYLKNKNINLRLNVNFKLKNEDNTIELLNKIKGIINRCVIKNKNENFYKEIIEISKNNNIKLVENIPFYEFKDVITVANGKNKFCIILPSYNNEKNIRNNLISIFYQNYKNYRIIYTNDNSQDKTEELFNKIIKEFDVKDKVIYKKNTKHSFQAYSKYNSYQMVENDEIVVILDGDDWLSRNDVLQTVSEYYNKTGCKVTYSNFLMYESENKYEVIKSKEYPDYVKKSGSYRKYSQWLFYHLRTGYGYLFKNIPENYLKYNDKWLDRVTDQAEMFCVGEMAGENVYHINEVLHIYNKANSLLYPNSHYNDADSKIRKQIEFHIKNILKPLNK
jgi:glycosyltransferase involved in cell wall biosynthesis